MFHYILQILVFQAIFLIAYDFLHKKDTFFSLNRFYLLITSAIPIVLPLFRIDHIKEIFIDPYSIHLSTILIGQKSKIDVATTSFYNSFDLNNWFLFYCTITLIMLCLFLKKCSHIYQLKKRAQQETYNNYNIYVLPNSTEAFSFLNIIFLGDQLSNTEKEHIITHEVIHVKERHSLDLIWFQLLKIFFWFNPINYIYQSRMITLHEYMADKKSVITVDKKSYCKQLLNSTFQTKGVEFTNQFFQHSLIKKRIIMLQKSKSRPISKLKYLSILPVIFIMLVYVSCSQEQPTSNVESFSDKNSTQEKDIPFTKLDKYPTPQNCKGTTGEELKKCVSSEIRTFVNTNFNVKAVEQYAEIGENRIYVRFKISKTGKIVDVEARAAISQLEEEAKRVIRSIPKMQPGEKDGQTVGVLYSMPIKFIIN